MDGVVWRLATANNIEVPRCLFPSAGEIVCLELHTFCDTSEEAYAAVTYSRAVYRDGAVVVRNVKVVTKLTPLKTLSIPKLELNAAVLGARLARLVETAITRAITSRYFWTERSTVRNWMRPTMSSTSRL